LVVVDPGKARRGLVPRVALLLMMAPYLSKGWCLCCRGPCSGKSRFDRHYSAHNVGNLCPASGMPAQRQEYVTVVLDMDQGLEI
jgi:hypothetical protein